MLQKIANVLSPYIENPITRSIAAQKVLDTLVQRSPLQARVLGILQAAGTAWWLSKIVEEMDLDDPPPDRSDTLASLRVLELSGQVFAIGRKWQACGQTVDPRQHTDVDSRVLSAINALPAGVRIRASSLAKRANVHAGQIEQSLARLRANGLVRKHQRSWSAP